MRICFTMLAAGVIALPVYAHAQDGQQTTSGAQGADQATQTFVEKAATGDMYEIQSSKLALDNSVGGDFQQFAQRIIDDHTAASQELKSIAQSVQGISVPSQLDAKHQNLIEKLQAASGAQFSKMYREQQIDAHQQAIELYENYSQDGQNSQLRQFADKTLPKLQQHLQMAQNLPEQPDAVSQAPAAGKVGGQQEAADAGKSRQNSIASPDPSHILASDLNGTTVYAAGGEEVGEVNDIVLSRQGELVALVVGVGGFLGMGEKNVAIPLQAVEIAADASASSGTSGQPVQNAPQSGSGEQNTGQTGGSDPNRVVLQGMSREDLEAAPSFEADRQGG